MNSFNLKSPLGAKFLLKYWGKSAIVSKKINSLCSLTCFRKFPFALRWCLTLLVSHELKKFPWLFLKLFRCAKIDPFNFFWYIRMKFDKFGAMDCSVKVLMELLTHICHMLLPFYDIFDIWVIQSWENMETWETSFRFQTSDSEFPKSKAFEVNY